MSRCRRCNSFKAVGAVVTLSPGLVENQGYSWKVQGVDFHPETKKRPGAFQVRDLCLACIIKLESWMDSQDVRLPGQEPLTGSSPALALVAWFLSVEDPDIVGPGPEC